MPQSQLSFHCHFRLFSLFIFFASSLWWYWLISVITLSPPPFPPLAVFDYAAIADILPAFHAHFRQIRRWYSPLFTTADTAICLRQRCRVCHGCFTPLPCHFRPLPLSEELSHAIEIRAFAITAQLARYASFRVSSSSAPVTTPGAAFAGFRHYASWYAIFAFDAEAFSAFTFSALPHLRFSQER